MHKILIISEIKIKLVLVKIEKVIIKTFIMHNIIENNIKFDFFIKLC